MPAPVMPKSATPTKWFTSSKTGALLSGTTATDELHARASNIRLQGGRNDDNYAIKDPTDVVIEKAGEGVDSIKTWGKGTFTMAANVENFYLLGGSTATVIGNAGDNLIMAKTGTNRLVTGGGDDVLVSGTGVDTFAATKAAGTTTWIQGFQASGAAADKIDLKGYGFNSTAMLRAAMSQVGGDVKINLGNQQSLWVEGRTVSVMLGSQILIDTAAASKPATPPTKPTVPTTSDTPLPGLKMTFHDEFDSLSLNTGKAGTTGNTWKTSDGWGNRTLSSNGELQYYVDKDYRGLGINPFSIDDGILTITAAKTDAATKAKLYGYNYTSGELTTAGSFSQQYGYFEMRARLPTEQGMWPAFWLLATDGKWPPELDVVEVVGKSPNYVYTTVHSKYGNKGKGTWISEDVGNAFHTYGMNWTKDNVTFYFDGRQVFETATPSDAHRPMYMLLNLAVGGHWPGSPDGTTNWANSKMKVDYVRVYEHDAGHVPSAGPAAGMATAKVMLGNGSDPLATAGTFTAPATAAGRSTTYTATQMGVAGVPGGTTVAVAYDAAGNISATNKGVWNAVKNAVVKDARVAKVTLGNFVDTRVTLGDGANVVSVTGAKRGVIGTGGGDDVIGVRALSNAKTDNVMTVDAGSGGDTVTFTGAANTKAAIRGGDGNDVITIAGKAAGTLDGGAGNDRLVVRSTGAVTLTGGAGDDVFDLLAGAHATITDFKAGADSITLNGVSASALKVTAQGGSTLLDLGAGAAVTLQGVALSRASVDLTFA